MMKLFIVGRSIISTGDNPLIIDGLNDVIIVGEAECCEQALDYFPGLRPNILLLETLPDLIQMIGAIVTIKSRYDGIGIIATSPDIDPNLTSKLFDAGAIAYISTEHIVDELKQVRDSITYGYRYANGVFA